MNCKNCQYEEGHSFVCPLYEKESAYDKAKKHADEVSKLANAYPLPLDKSQWEEEYWKKFNNRIGNCFECCEAEELLNDIKSFISTLLEKSRLEGYDEACRIKEKLFLDEKEQARLESYEEGKEVGEIWGTAAANVKIRQYAKDWVEMMWNFDEFDHNEWTGEDEVEASLISYLEGKHKQKDD